MLVHAFDEAWEHWPKKVERKAALEKFKTAARRVIADELAAHVIRFGDAYAATTDRQFVPALGVWLNGERWTDELPQPPKSSKKPTTKADQNAAAYFAIYGGDDDERTGSIQALDAGVRA